MQRENGKDIKMSFPQVVGGNLPLSGLLLKEEKQPCFRQKVEDPQQKLLGMTNFFDNGNNAFTLIELLVVVLIIGILAAVAVPQYQKAVEKSKAAQGIALVKSFAQAAEAYHLVNGTYATNADIDALDVGLSDEQKTKLLCADLFWDECADNGEWGITFQQTSGRQGVIAIRTSGPYAGAGFAMFQNSNLATVSTNTLYCYERNAGVYVLTRGSYCQKLFNGKWLSGYNSNAYLFALP